MDKERVIVYIDGFNLYHGLKEAGYKRFYWLNIQSLVESFIRPHQELKMIKYFTAKITTGDRAKKHRQDSFINAVKSLNLVEIIFGKYKTSNNLCPNYDRDHPEKFMCSGVLHEAKEKQTDVNIAIGIVSDALHNEYDTALLISGDTDLIPAMDYVRQNCAGKIVSVLFPPARKNDEMSGAATGSSIIGRKKLKDHQLPDVVIGKYGSKVYKPIEWN
jgi:uncharacterized LabA/DUF88 family protein